MSSALGPEAELQISQQQNIIGNGCLTPAFSGAQKRVEMLRHPCNLRGRQRQARGAKSELPHPCILGGPQTRGQNHEGPRRGDKIKSGYITPAFLGLPIAGRHEQETKRCLFSMQEWCLSIEPFSQPPPQDLGGSIDPPPLASSTCQAALPHLTSPHLTSADLASPHLTSSRLFTGVYSGFGPRPPHCLNCCKFPQKWHKFL